ncbi:MAG: rubredoxin [Burkholderiales bacterium]|jgi:rubredoxin|nr:rubredoxin [Burkholderiales bacterium]
MNTFEGSYLGDNAKIGPTTKLECKVCWYVYDPETGDEEMNIAPGIPFSELPDDWVCPLCGAAKDQFLVVRD